MDVHARQWHIITSLKFGLAEASAVVVSGQVYIGGGYSHKVEEYCVMTSYSDELLNPDSEWQFIANLPVKRPTLVTTNGEGRLLAFGGTASNQIHSYYGEKNCWELVSSFQEARANPLVTTLPEHFVVVGGTGCNRGVEMGACNDLSGNCSIM